MNHAKQEMVMCLALFAKDKSPLVQMRRIEALVLSKNTSKTDIFLSGVNHTVLKVILQFPEKREQLMRQKLIEIS